jgi:hypothetical protein
LIRVGFGFLHAVADVYFETIRGGNGGFLALVNPANVVVARVTIRGALLHPRRSAAIRGLRA